MADIFCNRCGISLPEGQAGGYCESCANVFTQQKQEVSEQKKNSKGETTAVAFAGFWLRFLAYWIDNIVIYSLYAVLIIAFAIPALPVLLSSPGSFPALLVLFLLMMLFAPFAYSVLLESSPLQATLGKYVLGIVVMDNSFSKCRPLAIIVRNFVKYYFELAFGVIFAVMIFLIKFAPISLASQMKIVIPLFIIFFLVASVRFTMAGVTVNKQALHDLFGKTYVVRRVESVMPRVLGAITIIIFCSTILPALTGSLVASFFSDLARSNPYFSPNLTATSTKNPLSESKNSSVFEHGSRYRSINTSRSAAFATATPPSPSVKTEGPHSTLNQKPEREIREGMNPDVILLDKDIIKLQRYNSLLKSISEMDRRSGLKGFESYGALAKDYLPAITAALNDRSELVQMAAVKALARFGADAAPAVPELRKALKSNNPTIAAAATQTMAQIGTPEALAAIGKHR